MKLPPSLRCALASVAAIFTLGPAIWLLQDQEGAEAANHARLAVAETAAQPGRERPGITSRACPARGPVAIFDEGAGLASWQTIGGCGAGASTGSGGGVKWIGRNVRGGLFHVECQANYTDVSDGYNIAGTTLLTADVTSRWNLGVSVPYLYKYMVDPFRVDVDLANKGPGDVTFLVTRRFGEIFDWSVTLAAGIATGTHEVEYLMQLLPQDRQLGLGKETASLTIDHTIDNLWGPIVLGWNANWRGGENHLKSYRAPSSSLYGYLSYLLGPFAPAFGVTATGFLGRDRDAGAEQALPRVSLAANLSLEWATDWVAVLVGASVPYDFAVASNTIRQHNRVGFPTFAVGFAFAPF